MSDSETHHLGGGEAMGFASAQPILRRWKPVIERAGFVGVKLD
ncbi:MAG: hypothetical protein ACJ8EN_09165 [Xanthobacteraceae bacterium]